MIDVVLKTRGLRTINCINQLGLENLRTFLEQNGFCLLELDGEQILDAETLFLKGVIRLPQDPQLSGKVNWDALSDSLWGGLDTFGKERVVIVWTKAENMLKRGLPDLLMVVDCFQQVIQEVATTESGISKPVLMLVFLVGEGENFRPFEIDEIQKHSHKYSATTPPDGKNPVEEDGEVRGQ